MSWKFFKKRSKPDERITSATSGTVDRNSHRAEDGVQPSKLCSKCAAVDFPALFTDFPCEIKLGRSSTWKLRECVACEFFSQCFSVATDEPILLCSTQNNAIDHILGIINRALPDAFRTGQFGTLEAGGVVPRQIVRSHMDLGLKKDLVPPIIDLRLVKDWVQEDAALKRQHAVPEYSSPRKSSFYPRLPLEKNEFLVVIDCQSRDLVQITSETAYVTLSYMWGSLGAVLESDCDASNISERLPPTIEDSIFVCLELGYRYLWVDRYCIPQTHSLERHRLIQRMDKIYAQSTLTIVACAGNDPQYGLSGVSRPRECLPHVFINGSSCLQALPAESDIHQSAWARRGWTYQEALLSQRRLYFTDSQLYFEDHQSVRCEWATQREGTSDRRMPWIFSPHEYLTTPIKIYTCIQEYTGRKVSFESDILNAMLGIFAFFERCHQVRHIWGMPYSSAYEGYNTADDLRLSCLWSSLTFEALDDCIRRTAFPSWSWLGWEVFPIWCSVLPLDGNAYVLNICPELLSGSVISWSDYEDGYGGRAMYNQQLSRFIHVQAYMSSIESFGVESMYQNWNSRTLKLIDGTKLDCEASQVFDRIEHRLKYILLIHTPMLQGEQDIHLLVEDLGDHWERIGLLKANIMDYGSREKPPGNLRTIRLG
jgi:hypothetical protein